MGTLLGLSGGVFSWLLTCQLQIRSFRRQKFLLKMNVQTVQWHKSKTEIGLMVLSVFRYCRGKSELFSFKVYGGIGSRLCVLFPRSTHLAFLCCSCFVCRFPLPRAKCLGLCSNQTSIQSCVFVMFTTYNLAPIITVTFQFYCTNKSHTETC